MMVQLQQCPTSPGTTWSLAWMCQHQFLCPSLVWVTTVEAKCVRLLTDGGEEGGLQSTTKSSVFVKVTSRDLSGGGQSKSVSGLLQVRRADKRNILCWTLNILHFSALCKLKYMWKIHFLNLWTSLSFADFVCFSLLFFSWRFFLSLLVFSLSSQLKLLCGV